VGSVPAWQPVVVVQLLIVVAPKGASVCLHKTDFSRASRLLNKADFACMKKGKRFRIKHLSMVVVKNDRQHARLGFAVSGKYGNAVCRNRLKRCLRSAFRQHDIRDKAFDILVIPTPQFDANAVSEQHMHGCFDDLSQRLGR